MYHALAVEADGTGKCSQPLPLTLFPPQSLSQMSRNTRRQMVQKNVLTDQHSGLVLEWRGQRKVLPCGTCIPPVQQ